MQAAATPGYFRAMGIPLLRGRLFTASDGRMSPLMRDLGAVQAYLQSAELVAVINETGFAALRFAFGLLCVTSPTCGGFPGEEGTTDRRSPECHPPSCPPSPG